MTFTKTRLILVCIVRSEKYSKIDQFIALSAMAHFHNIPERLEVTDGAFSSLLGGSEVTYFQNNDKGFIYTLVFDEMTWLVTSISITLSSLAYFIISSNQGITSSSASSNTIELLLEAITLNIKVVLALDYGNFQVRRHLVARILLLTISLNGALLYWSYTGSLVSFFTVESETPPITSFQDILNVPNLKLLMRAGNSEAQHLFNAMEKDKVLKEKLPEIIVWFNSTDEMYKMFMTKEDDNDFVLFTPFFYTQYFLRRKGKANVLCDIRHKVLNDARAQELVGWLYPKNSLLRKLFDKFLINLYEQGIERRLFSKHFIGVEEDQCNMSSETTPIAFQIVAILFKILAFGCILAIILLSLEIVSKHLKWVSIQ